MFKLVHFSVALSSLEIYVKNMLIVIQDCFVKKILKILFF